MIRKLIQSQTKLYNSQTCFFSELANTLKETNLFIKKGYLIPQPPGKSLSLYNLYSKQKFEELKNQPGNATQKIVQISKDFKNDSVDVQLKDKLKKSLDKVHKDHQAEVDKYNKKYGIPPSPLNTYAYYSQLYHAKNKPTGALGDIAKQISESYKNLSVAEKSALKSDLDSINSKRVLAIQEFDKKFKIPQVKKVSNKTLYCRENGIEGRDEQNRAWGSVTQEQKELYSQKAKVQSDLNVQEFEKFLKKNNITENLFKKLQKKYVKKNDIQE